MRSQTIIFFLTLSLAITTVVNVFAQPNMSANIQNMHLWRGMEVADGIVLTTEVSVSDPQEHFTAGVWGGINSTGTYKEFDYFVSYTNHNFKFSLWDIYNFSPGASYNNSDIFNYKSGQSGRFLDATLSYRLAEKFPLLLNWSTIIFGRDRGEDNQHNIYSTFCYAEYPVYKYQKWRCDVGVGGAFALNNPEGGANFYSDRGGIIEATIRLTYDLSIGNHTMPISARAMWNPQAGDGFLQLSAQLFSF